MLNLLQKGQANIVSESVYLALTFLAFRLPNFFINSLNTTVRDGVVLEYSNKVVDLNLDLLRAFVAIIGLHLGLNSVDNLIGKPVVLRQADHYKDLAQLDRT